MTEQQHNQEIHRPRFKSLCKYFFKIVNRFKIIPSDSITLGTSDHDQLRFPSYLAYTCSVHFAAYLLTKASDTQRSGQKRELPSFLFYYFPIFMDTEIGPCVDILETSDLTLIKILAAQPMPSEFFAFYSSFLHLPTQDSMGTYLNTQIFLKPL